MSRKTIYPLHKIQLYQFKDFDMADFTDRYLRKVNPHEEIDPASLSVYTPPKSKLTKKREGARSESIIENKCRYLQDAIIRRAFSKKDSLTFSMNANILKAVIRNDYKPLLEVFTEMGYIEIGDGKGGQGSYWYYQVGESSKLYTLKNTNVYKTEPFINQAIQAYKEKTIEEIKKLEEGYTNQAIQQKHGETFLAKYLKSLRQIRIENEEGLNDYIASHITNDNYLYYEYVRRELEQKEKVIQKIDASGRIYHILTNLERELKQFLNIDFSLDCKNSHPLLFNYFIFNKLNISLYSSYNISNFFTNNLKYFIRVNNHNVGRKLRILLNSNNIENSSVAKMSNDELEYVYLTSTGQLWDDIVSKHPDLDRTEVKVEMFKAVFYSHSPVPERYNTYASEFKERFPRVFELIGDWKRRMMADKVVEYMKAHALPFDKGSASLSIAMMALEAEIFTTILQRLYSKRWNAVHIHDCIVIPKDGNMNHPTIEQVKQIMLEVYRDFGLSPTLDDK